MSNENKQLIPPFRFAIIEEGLYRGSYPTERNLRFLKRLKLKTIVSLTPKPPLKPFLNFCERYNTTSKHFPVSKFKDDVTISSSQVVQLLELMIDPANLPLYCHCLDGANVTGTIFMCLRKLQNWNLSAIISEFTRFTRGSCISSSESEFVETFKAEIDVPLSIPVWLWQGVRMTKHPTLKLRLIGPSPTHQHQPHHNQPTHHSNSAFAPLNGSTSPPINSPIPVTGSLATQQSSISPLVSGINSNTLPQSIPPQQTILTSADKMNCSNNPHHLTVQVHNITNNNIVPIKTPTLNPNGTSNPITPSGNAVIPNISTLISGASGGGSSSSTHSKDKEKDKKKKIEDIKLQFDAGKFNQPVESKSLDALSLERLPVIQTTTSNCTTSSNSSVTSISSTVATPTINRTLLQTSSEVAFTNINLLSNLNIAKQQNDN